MLGNIGAALEGFGQGKMWKDRQKLRERELDVLEADLGRRRDEARAERAGIREDRAAEQASYAPPTSDGGHSYPVARSIDPGAPPAARSAPAASSSPAAPRGTASASNSWLRYNNKGATRNKPLSDDLISRLGYLEDMGIEMEVFSGGQDGIETGSKHRVGSTRHDHGGAGDVFFYKDGRRLDWANEADQPIFDEIVRRGVAAGVTGFGAGPGYMQQGSMHIGMGGGGVWGAGGKGANAPSWLKAAYGNPWVEPQRPAAAVAASSSAPSVMARGIEATKSIGEKILDRIKG